jgi:hypothetical protein
VSPCTLAAGVHFKIILNSGEMKKENTETTLEQSSFTLPNEIVIVKHIPRRRGMAANVDDNHVISGGMLMGSVKKFSAPLQRNGGIANILSEDEKEYLEKVTGTNLSVYGDFWKTFIVSLYKESENNRFDLSNPFDYISVKLLQKYKDDVAPTWEERDRKSSYEFVITRSDEELNEKKQKYDSKKQAFKLYGKIEDDKEKLLGVLKLLSNQPISKESSLKWLQAKVEEYIDTMPSLFVSVINDASYETKILINNAVDKGIIKISGNKYSTADGLELSSAGQIATFDNAVRYLDAPKNQEVRAIIEAKLDK